MEDKIKILAVDDEEINLSIMKLIFEAPQYELALAATGQAGLESVEKFQPDVILLDVMMPGIDGFEVCKRIYADQKNKYRQTIFVTVKASDAERLLGYKLGAVDYVCKPFLEQELRAKVDVLGRQAHSMNFLNQQQAALAMSLADESEPLGLRTDKWVSMGRMTPGVIHEFNNLIYVINGYSNLIREQIADNELFSSHVDHIQQATTQAADLVARLLGFARADEATLEVLEGRVLLEEVRSFLTPVLACDIRCVEPSPMQAKNPIALRLNKVLLMQALFNLVLNANDALEPGGFVLLDATIEKFSAAHPTDSGPTLAPGNYACLSVQDNGSGLDQPALQENIFSAFVTTKQGGRGLGLSIVAETIMTMGGGIDCHSALGEGCRFELYLPLAEYH